MNPELESLTRNMSKGESAQSEDVESVFGDMKIMPPTDYIEFLSHANGAEGPIGPSGYLVLWPIEQIREFNAAYHVEEFAPDLVLIGSDGGDIAFGFDRRSQGVVMVPFIGMSMSETRRLGDQFLDLLRQLAS